MLSFADFMLQVKYKKIQAEVKVQTSGADKLLIDRCRYFFTSNNGSLDYLPICTNTIHNAFLFIHTSTMLDGTKPII